MTLYVWNFGGNTIDKSDLPAADSLRFGSEEINILEASIVRQSRPAVSANIRISDDAKYSFIEFDYLDPEDGLVFNVLFDQIPKTKGLSVYPSITGSIKGARGGPKSVPFQRSKPNKLLRHTIAPVLGIFFGTTTVLLAYDVYADATLSLMSAAKLIAATILGIISLITILIWFIVSLEEDPYVIPETLLPDSTSSNFRDMAVRIGTIELAGEEVEFIDNDSNNFNINK
jgi:hypothetical protein